MKFINSSSILCSYTIFIINLINNLSNAQICEFTLPDGLKYNFSNLKQSKDFVIERIGLQYKVNLCGPLRDACSKNSQAPAAIFKQSINYLTKRL
jgi:hypothetical protein